MNQFGYRGEWAHYSCACEDNDNRDVDPIGKGWSWRLESHVVHKQWQDEIKRDEANCSYYSTNVSNERKHCCQNPTEYHVQGPKYQRRYKVPSWKHPLLHISCLHFHYLINSLSAWIGIASLVWLTRIPNPARGCFPVCMLLIRFSGVLIFGLSWLTWAILLLVPGCCWVILILFFLQQKNVGVTISAPPPIMILLILSTLMHW